MIRSLLVVGSAALFAFGCAAAPPPSPADPLAADLEAMRTSGSRADDAAYHPQGETEFTMAEPKAPSAGAQAAPQAPSLRMDGAARNSKQKVHAASR